MIANPPVSQGKVKRPTAVSFVVVLAALATCIYGIQGILAVVNSPLFASRNLTPLLQHTNLDHTSVQFLGGVYYILVALGTLIIGWGAFRMRRWAWIAFLAWCIFVLANQILRYYAGSPDFIAMALAVFVVLALNQAEVQAAFGIAKPTDVESELEPLSDNPLDSK